MAKRPRMGRNLNALLGGASRDRVSGKPASNTRAAPENDVPLADSGDSKEAPLTSTANRTASGTAANEPEKQSAEQSARAISAQSTEIYGEPKSQVTTRAEPDDTGSNDRLRMIGVDQIRRGSYQPRRLFDPELLQELADSIKAEGVIQPIIVRPFADGFELVAGERRWRASQLAGLSEIPAIVRQMEDQSVASVALIENIQRKDLNPLEEATAFERLCDEFGMTHKAVADSVGRSRTSVTNLLRLLELHDEVKVLVDKGELEMGHARAILGAPTEQQFDIAKQVIKRGLTVRAVEKLIRELNNDALNLTPLGKDKVVDPDIERLSQKLGETLGASVKIQHRHSGAGKLEITYSSVAELQGILAHIK